MPWLVPEIEEREAARFAGYTWREWSELSHEGRVNGVAHYRVKSLLEAHAQDAVRSEQEARERANRSRRHR